MIRTNALLDSTGRLSSRPDIGSMKKPPKEKWDEIKRRHLKANKREGDLTAIEEEVIEEEIVVGGENGDGEKADIIPDGMEIKAERFNFTF